MFSELIYTRCRQGIDILRLGKTISSDGFKVFSCTSSLINGGYVDLQLLFNAAQTKQSYIDPIFMDDSYLFFTPDKGKSFIVNFHPRTYDKNAEGDYSHRAGNFVNQIIVGDYSNFYPFELFNDKNVWYAKNFNEAYYYENKPTPLPTITDFDLSTRSNKISDIAKFISNGRHESLMSCVSFLISQYSLPWEKRKYLVIRDDSSEKIELWISAIELAFSPRISSSVSFASRMDKFTTSNLYTVNQYGEYQTQINLQDPNQKSRYRAMIVGVNENDKNNISEIRHLANSPYVILEGKTKTALFESDISHPYYKLITKFDNDHLKFCVDFLQMFDIKSPCYKIYDVFDLFILFEQSFSGSSTDKISKCLRALDNFAAVDLSKFSHIYNKIKLNVPNFYKDNISGALQIINWLKIKSKLIGDSEFLKEITSAICKLFSDQLFIDSNMDFISSNWEIIRRSEFSFSVAEYIISKSTFQTYLSYINRFTPLRGIFFTLIYLDCASLVNNISKEDIRPIVDFGLKFCFMTKDSFSALTIINSLYLIKNFTIQDIFFAAIDPQNPQYSEFIIKLLLDSDSSIIKSHNSIVSFLDSLDKLGMKHLYAYVLKLRINYLQGIVEINQYISLVRTITTLPIQDLINIYESMDRILSINDPSNSCIAVTIQKFKPLKSICPNSAHIYALHILDDIKTRPIFTHIFDELILQGFPFIDDSGYIQSLVKQLFNIQISPEELRYTIQLFSRVQSYINVLVAKIMKMTSPQHNIEWNVLINTALKYQELSISNSIINECLKLKYTEKHFSKLNDMLLSSESRDYFYDLTEKIKSISISTPKNSVFSKLYNIILTIKDNINNNK